MDNVIGAAVEMQELAPPQADVLERDGAPGRNPALLAHAHTTAATLRVQVLQQLPLLLDETVRDPLT